MYRVVALLSSVNVKWHKNFVYFPFTVKIEPWRPGLTKSQAFQVFSKFRRFEIVGKETEKCVDHCYKVEYYIF